MKPGVYTAVITPFCEDGSFDREGFRENLRFQVFSGVQGIVVLGTTGEAPTLEADEKKEILEIAVDEIKGKAHLIIGTGSYSTKKTIADTLFAKEIGADAALVVTPYYNKPTQEGLFRHFDEVSKVDFPLIVYNVQGRTGQNIQTETLARLAAIPQIIGVKEASGNLIQMMDVLEKILASRADFKIFSGDDNLTFPLICLGGHGIISVASNLIPQPIIEMVQAAFSGNMDRARKLHFELLPLFKAAFIETNPIPIKAMMKKCGMPSGPCRLPLCDLAPHNEHIVLNTLNQVHPWLNAIPR